MPTAATKIDRTIVGYSVQQDVEQAPAAETVEADHKVVQLNEPLERPEVVTGSTYKIISPMSEHALYVTINDVVNEDGSRRPFELFINSKNMEHFQWVAALTRLISAVFRMSANSQFLVEELSEVFDPKGWYFIPGSGGKQAHSLVHHIGIVLEQHMKYIGMIGAPELDEHQKALIAEKRAQYEARQQAEATPATDSDFPDGATVCTKCNVKAAIMMDGCKTCLNCGESKCG